MPCRRSLPGLGLSLAISVTANGPEQFADQDDVMVDDDPQRMHRHRFLIGGVHRLRRRSYAVEGHEKSLGAAQEQVSPFAPRKDVLSRSERRLFQQVILAQRLRNVPTGSTWCPRNGPWWNGSDRGVRTCAVTGGMECVSISHWQAGRFRVPPSPALVESHWTNERPASFEARRPRSTSCSWVSRALSCAASPIRPLSARGPGRSDR